MAYIQNSVYHPGDSILHSTGARIKILLALACIFVTGTGDGFALLLMFFLCHLGMLVSGIFFLDAWKRLATLKIFFLVLGVTPLFLTPGAPLYFSSEFSLPVTKEGLVCSLFTVSRLVCMVWISMILIHTTSPQSLMEIVSGSKKLDWEVELGIIIGKNAKHISESQSQEHILGYCLVNDVSEREWQIEKMAQRVKGKSHDT